MATDEAKSKAQLINELADLRRRLAEFERHDAFRTLIENASDGLLIADGEGRHLFANRRAAEITGRTVDELLRLRMHDLAHPDELPVLAERLRKRIHGEDAPAQYETRIVAKDGAVVHVEATGAKAEWGGRPVTVVVLRDVTERRLLRESLRETEARFQRVFDQSPLGTALVDLDGRFIRVNEAFCRFLGYSEAELLERSFVDVTHPAHVEFDIEQVRRLIAGEIERYVTDKRYLCKDGEVVWGHLSVSALKDAAGRPLCFVPLVEDITERKRAEDLLRKTEARYRHIFENSLLGIFQSTPEGAFLSMNRAFANMTGYETPEEMKAAVSDIQQQLYVKPEDRARIKQMLAAFGIVRGFETEIRRRDGSTLWIAINARAVRDPRTGKVFYEGTTLDITERKRAEDELRRHRAHLEEVVARRTAALADRNDRLKAEIEARSRMERELVNTKEAAEAANRAKSAFLAAMSHEFRTPLNAIIGFSEVLGEQRFGLLNDKQTDFVRRILTGGRHLLQMISDVLDISQIEAGKVALEPTEADVVALLHESAAMVAGQAELGGLELTVEASAELANFRLLLDQRRFRQIMLNLLSNAVKYTPRGGKVTITGELSDQQLAICVRDTGLGIELQDQKRVFGEFERIDVANEKRHPGVGLGLALTRKLVELQGGTISVHSEGHLKGSAFTFVLPAQASGQPTLFLPGPPPPLDERPPPAPRTPLQGRGKRVLVVEDDLVSRHLVAVLLKEHGCAVLEAASGQEGIAAATQELPDLILMDVGLPDMSGLEAVRRLRQAEPTQRIPIIALTAYAMKGDREQCFAAGCDDYIAKPVGTSALLKLISEFLERSPAPAA